jgi:hypothetical protein
MNDEYSDLFTFEYKNIWGGIVAIDKAHDEIYAISDLDCEPTHCEITSFRDWCEATYDESDFLTGLEVGCAPARYKGRIRK